MFDYEIGDQPIESVKNRSETDFFNIKIDSVICDKRVAVQTGLCPGKSQWWFGTSLRVLCADPRSVESEIVGGRGREVHPKGLKRQMRRINEIGDASESCVAAGTAILEERYPGELRDTYEKFCFTT
ncbi:hypothetical protein TNCV_2836511 [Trichonephila clavipes]|nr:hypothetical protein TNCV_2836511 [Trichonephila clavipes]